MKIANEAYSQIRTAKVLHSIRSLIVAGLVLSPAISALATTDTWTGGTSVDWNTAGNWNSGAGPAPGSGDTALFNGAGGGHTSVTFSSASSLNSLTFDGSSVAAYLIGTTGGSALTLSTGGTIQTTSTVANAETVNAPIVLGGNYTFSSNSSTAADTLNFGGTINKNGKLLTLTGSNTGTNTISGVISSTGGLTKSGVGSWILSGLNTYTGATTVSGGTLTLIGDTGTLASATTYNGNGGTFIFSNSNASGTQSQTVGATTFTAGPNVVENLESGAGSSVLNINQANVTTSITSLTGVSVNFVTSGSATITNATAINGANSHEYYNGANYAYFGGAGAAISAPVYDGVTDGASFITGNPSTVYTSAQNNFYFKWTASNTTGATQGAFNFGTMLFSGTGAINWTETGAGANSIQGFLRSGGTAATPGTTTISGGTYRSGTGENDITIRTDSIYDSILFNSAITSVNTANGQTYVVKSGAGTLTLASALNNFGGNLNVNEGTVKVTSTTGLGWGAPVGTTQGGGYIVGNTQVAQGATLDIGGSSALTIDEPIVLSGATLTNTSATTTTLNNGIAGVLLTNLGAGYTSLPSTLTISGTTGSGAAVSVTAATGAVTSITLTNAGTGYTGPLTATFNGSGQTTTATATAVLDSVTLNGTANTIGGNNGGLTIKSVIADGTSSGGFTKSGTDTVVLSGANTYTGGTTISGGLLQTGNASALGSSSGSLTDNATLDLASNSVGVGAFNGTGTVLNSTSSSASTLTVGNGNASGTFSGLIENNAGSGGTVALSKVGTGTQTLTTGNTYSGGTTVNAGELLLGNGVTGSATGSGALAVLSTGTLAGVGRSASGNNGFNIAGKVIAGNGTATDTTGVTTITGTSTLHNSTLANATLAFNLDTASTNASSINVGSTGVDFGSTAFSLTLGAGNSIIAANTPYILISGVNSGGLAGVDGSQYSGFTTDASGADGLLAGQYKILTGLTLSFTNDSGYYSSNSFLFLNTVGGVDNIEVEVVPEPSTWAMMLGGLALLLFRLRRKASKARTFSGN